ncbi:phage tail tape measure protein [Weissella ceti]|uniref:Phage tail tape measure protein n=1 Tax=Weissella ceti TaxID=759620 RepID=A0ABT3E531_9LACO|nr:phage tail tape measure protein [Weissella ceti]MCW0953002.1 phage tail tape measure protein [Weissella ceti]QVK11548.1 phage tail tape measure protein [Weissella ceti]
MADMSLGKMKITVGLDGKGVTDGVSKLERDIKGGVRNFSSFSAAARRGGQELEITKAKIGMLGSSIQNMEKITSQYNKVLNDSTQMSKLTGSEQAALRQEYDQSTVKLNAYKQQFVDTSREMAEMQVKTQGWTGALNSAGEKLTTVGSSLTKKVTLPMGAIGAMALKVGFDFEEGMSRVKAISGATGAEMEKLEKQARQLGKDTAFSARETAQGMENLAMAGFSVNEIMAATPGLLDLAAVSGKDIGLAAEISAGTLRSFGLEAGEAGRVADVLAKTATSAATDTSDLGEAMKYIAPVAHQLGMSVEETSAAIGVMANHSIKGSQAGTTMRMALTRMAKPTGEARDAMEELGITYFDAQGKMKPFSNILSDLKTSMAKMSDEQRAATLKTLFGQTALSGMMALVGEAPGVYDDFTESLNNSAGAADEMARTMQDNANNSIEQMMGSLEDAGIAIARIVTPAFRDIAGFVEKCADAFSDLDPEAQKIIVKLGLLAMAAGPTALVLGKLTTSAVSMHAAFNGMQAAKGAATAIGMVGTSATSASAGIGMLAGGATKAVAGISLMNPVVPGTVGVVAALGVAIGGVKWLEGQAHAKRWGDGVSESAGKALDSVKNTQSDISISFAKTTDDGKLASEEVGKAFSDMNDEVQKNITDANKKISEGFSLLPKDLQDSLNKAKKAFENKNKDIADESKKISETIKNIEQQSGKETLEQQQYIHQSRLRMNELSVKSLGLNAEQEKEALRNLNASVTDMTSEQRRESVKGLADLASKTVESYDKQRATVKDFYDKGMLSSDEYKASISELDDLQDKAN